MTGIEKGIIATLLCAVGLLSWVLTRHDYATTTVLKVSYTPGSTSVGYTFNSSRGGGMVVTGHDAEFKALVATGGGGPEEIRVPKERFMNMKEGDRVCVDWIQSTVVNDSKCVRETRR